jgi:curved DNA-binding protein CbpA
MPFHDYYSILGLEHGKAKVSELKSAYKKVAIRLHPDKNPGDPRATEKFQLLRAALETLEDANKRNAYQKVYEKYKVYMHQLQPLLNRRHQLREQRAEMQKDWLLTINHDWPRWDGWTYQNYVECGGGDEEIEEEICKVLDRKLNISDNELCAIVVPISDYMEMIDDLELP